MTVSVRSQNVRFVDSSVVELIEKLLVAAGMEGLNCSVHYEDHTKGTAQTQGISARRKTSDGHAALLRVQPGSNKTCVNVRLYPPTGMDVDDFVRELREAEVPNTSNDRRFRHKMPDFYQRMGGKNFFLRDVSDKVISDLGYKRNSFGSLLALLANDRDILVSAGRGSYMWTESFRQRMSGPSKDPLAVTSSQISSGPNHVKQEPQLVVAQIVETSASKPNDVGTNGSNGSEPVKPLTSEEDAILERVVEIENELNRVDYEGVDLAQRVHRLKDTKAKIEAELRPLMVRIDELHAQFNQCLQEVESASKDLAKTKAARQKLIDEKADLDQKLAAVDAEKKIAGIVSRAEEVFKPLSEQERADVLQQLVARHAVK